MATESEQRLIIDHAVGYPGGVKRIRNLVDSASHRIITQAQENHKRFSGEVLIFNGLADRGKSIALDEVRETIETNNRIKQLGIPVKVIKIEDGMKRAEPKAPEEKAKRFLSWKSGNYEPEDYAAGSEEFEKMVAEALLEPCICLAETVGVVGYKFPNDENVAGWDIGGSTVCDLARKNPPFQQNYNASFIVLDADDTVVSRGKIDRIHRSLKDSHEIKPTLGLYSRGDNLGGGVLDSVIKIEQLFYDILREQASKGIITKDPEHRDKETREYFYKYYKEWLNIPKSRLFMGWNYWLGKIENEVENDGEDAA